VRRRFGHFLHSFSEQVVNHHDSVEDQPGLSVSSLGSKPQFTDESRQNLTTGQETRVTD
jgi:hypothetical protein